MIIKTPSKSENGVIHITDLAIKECSCEGFKFRGTCSHIEDNRE